MNIQHTSTRGLVDTHARRLSSGCSHAKITRSLASSASYWPTGLYDALHLLVNMTTQCQSYNALFHHDSLPDAAEHQVHTGTESGWCLRMGSNSGMQTSPDLHNSGHSMPKVGQRPETAVPIVATHAACVFPSPSGAP